MNEVPNAHQQMLEWLESTEGQTTLKATAWSNTEKLCRAFKAGQVAERERLALAAARKAYGDIKALSLAS